ncbi:MAG: class I SAM-dependent methyltransferase [Patescibacteria group bacterium]
MKNRETCRCCNENNLFPYLNLGLQPLANSYHKGENLKKYQLKVMLCENCFHSQLSVVVERDLMFKNYLYVSGTTETFRNHLKQLAEDAVSRVGEKLNLDVLDIACNDATLLEYFKKLGCYIQGVDPAENLQLITKKKKIPVEVNYWTQNLARKLRKKFDIITGTNVFAHVDDLDEFLKACKIALKPNGLLILEFPYCNMMIENNEFDTVYHEHLSYFLVNSFKTLIERMNFHIIDLLQTPIHGGSIRFFLKDGNGEHSNKVYRIIKLEKAKDLLDKAAYKIFSNRIHRNKKDLKNLVKKLKEKKQKMIGYGASAKGNTMLNYFKLDLDYVVDDNPLKWGYFTPGRNIPIRNPNDMKLEKNGLNIVILSWNFSKEILTKIANIRGENRSDRYILYIPTVQIKSV